MEESLRQKQLELDNLQASYDEFLENSKELEAELEKALGDLQAKYDDSEKKRNVAEEKAKITQENLNKCNKALLDIQTEIEKLREKNTLVEEIKKKLENENEELSTKVRILESNEEGLQSKLTDAEENLIYLKTDLEDLRDAKREMEASLQDEIGALKSQQQSSVTNELSTIANPEETSSSCNEAKIEYLEKMVDSLQQTLAEIESKNLSFKADNESLKSIEMSLNSQLLEYESLLNIERASNDSLKAHLVDLNAKLSEASNAASNNVDTDQKFQILETTIVSLNNSLSEIKLENVNLRQQSFDDTSRLKSDNNALDSLNKESLGTIESLRRYLEESEKRYTNLQEKFNSSQAQETSNINAESVKDTELQEKVESQERIIDMLNQSLEEMEKEISTLKESKGQFSSTPDISDNIDFASIADNLKQLVREKNEQIASQEMKITELQQSIQDLQRKLSDSVCEMNALSERNYSLPNPNRSSSSSLSNSKQGSSPRNRRFDSEGSLQKQIRLTMESGRIEEIKRELELMIAKYEKVKFHNISLQNKIQASRGNILVCCRTRPANDSEIAGGGKTIVDASDENELMCFDPKMDSWRSFVFDRVWKPESTQSDVFLDVEPLVISVVDGYNACIMAYGQTGSGKTHTMEGYENLYGVNFRAMETIFDILDSRKAEAEENLLKRQSLVKKSDSDDVSASSEGDDADKQVYTISMSMMEIYNEQVYDLLLNAIGGGQTDGVSLDIRQSPDGTISVPGLKQVQVSNIDDVIAVFAKGTSNRATATTNLNEHSSRSHLIVEVEVVTKNPGEIGTKGKLYLVDLAGSERVGKSGATGTVMKEAQYINKSLLSLGDVMEALDQKQKYVPYRNSKLTFLLQNSLGGHARTMMIVTVCPTDLTADETLFTLQFATRVRNITLGAALKYSNAKALEQQVKILKAELREAKRKKSAADEALLEMKKEAKKSTDKVNAPLEAKVKLLEEGKRTAEATVQHLTKQLQEATAKLADERALKEKSAEELEMSLRNLKRALEQIREVTAEKDHYLTLLKSKDRELDSVQAALLRSISNDEYSTSNQSRSKNTSPSHKHRVSFPPEPAVVFVLPPPPAAEPSNHSIPAKPSQDSKNHSLSTPVGKDTPMGPPKTSIPKPSTAAASTPAAAVPAASPFLTPSAVSATPTSASATKSSRSVAMSPSRYGLTRNMGAEGMLRRSSGNNSSHTSSTPDKKPTGLHSTPTTTRTPNSSGNTPLSSAAGKDSSISSSSGISRIPASINSRTEEALRRHQARMGKRRDTSVALTPAITSSNSSFSNSGN